ncbi:hypothetical protein [Halomicronema sp. CCY15110]|uniref:hypothetical protein n=1 Tax=Halomicronema sp. CCY15110 TaxID=2767773 RepID=UPI001951FA91|nr:hypothetical protein [Halomicronema sp. CCY15110]
MGGAIARSHRLNPQKCSRPPHQWPDAPPAAVSALPAAEPLTPSASGWARRAALSWRRSVGRG